MGTTLTTDNGTFEAALGSHVYLKTAEGEDICLSWSELTREQQYQVELLKSDLDGSMDRVSSLYSSLAFPVDEPSCLVAC